MPRSSTVTMALNHFGSFFLARLVRLLALDSLPISDGERRIVRRVLFITYLDCRDVGVGDAAEALIALRPGPGGPADAAK